MDTLNPREREVLARMAEGRSNVGIAKDLYLSPRTVEAHVTSVFGKLGLEQTDTDNNRIRAVLAYLRLAGDQEGPGQMTDDVAAGPASYGAWTLLTWDQLPASSPA